MLESLILLAVSAGPVVDSRAPLTVAEASGFTKTSSHVEVLEFLDELRHAGAHIRVETIGETTEGRKIPLVILSRPLAASMPDPRTRHKVAVCIQANIHGGEVDGKEAALMLLRDISIGELRHLGDDLILLVIPNYNPDGNDAFGPGSRNRRSQPGPELVGQRYNGQGLDLNRDCMKARSPEFRAVATRVLNRWDPDIFIDLHTTNGSYHAYPLLFATPLHPGGPAPPAEFARDRLLPDVQRAMRRRHGYEIFPYGNFDNQANPTRWATFDYKGRMGWNYIGLRGRIGILSESYAYASYRTRVEVGYHFVEEILRAAARHAEQIRRVHRESDALAIAWGTDPRNAPPVALRGRRVAAPEQQTVLIEESADPPEGSRRRVRMGLVRAKILPIHDRFEPTLSVPYPAGYLLPPSMADTAAHLELHGIRVERLESDWTGTVETWTPTSLEVRNRRWEGGRALVVDVNPGAAARSLPRGSFLVRTAQPLGVLAVHLLEPQSPDSVVAWELAPFEPRVGEPLPYYRISDPDAVPGIGK